MRKKLCAVLVVVVLFSCCLALLSACKNEEYQYVKSITITTAGETKTFKSTCYAVSVSQEFISKEEYDSAPPDAKGDYYPQVKLPPKNKIGATAYHEAFETNMTRYMYVYEPLWGGLVYRKHVYKGVNYYYIQVKVIDNTTIEVKSFDGTITTYTVTSYKIVPLEE